MTRTKQQVRDTRRAAFSGTVGGVLLFTMVHLMIISSGSGQLPLYSLLLGKSDQWPSYLLPFWPLDLIASCFWFWLLAYLAIKFVGQSSSNTSGINTKVRSGAGIFLAGAGVGGCFGTGFGWYFGIEMAVMFGIIVAVVMAGLILIEFVLEWVCPRVGQAWKRAQPRVRASGLTPPFIRLSHYLKADDVPDDKPPATNAPSQH